jgi:hypothetical protein
MASSAAQGWLGDPLVRNEAAHFTVRAHGLGIGR